MAKDKKNTGKAPAVLFYYKDFMADMEEHPPVIVGAWFMVLIKIWHAGRNGKITLSLKQYASIMHVRADEADKYLNYIGKGIADVTQRNGEITVVNRRTQRDCKLLDQNRLRQQKYRDARGDNADVAALKGNPSKSVSNSQLDPLRGSLKFKKSALLRILKKDHGMCFRWFLSEFGTQTAHDRNTLEKYAKLCTVLLEDSNFITWLHDTVADIARQKIAHPGRNRKFIKALNNKIEKTNIDRWVKG